MSRMIRNITFIILVVWISFPNTSYGQNKLDKSKKELTSDSGVKNTNTTSKQSSSGSSDSEDNFFETLFVDLIGYSIMYVTVGDYHNENHLHSAVTPYPFYNKISGNFENQDTVYMDAKHRFRLDVEDHFMYSTSDLIGNHLKVKIRPFQYFYLQTDYRQLFESGISGNSQLSLFHFNFGYDRLRFQKVNLGWTLGATYVGNEVNKAGFSYGFSADYFPTRHVSLSSNIKFSKINGHTVNAFEVQGKYHLKRYFVGLGYQNLKIATPTYNFVTLGGGIYI